MENTIDLAAQLSGPNAFYAQPGYELQTKRELADTLPVEQPSYRYESEGKVWKFVKEFLYTISFGGFGYRAIQNALSYVVAPPTYAEVELQDLGKKRLLEVDALGDNFKVKRISLLVDGLLVDAMIIGTPETLAGKQKRWTVFSNGTRECFENRLEKKSFKQIITELDSNAIVFNYPGVGSSEGVPNRKTMTSAYKAVLRFLEDKNQGMGAEEIIGYGFSLGGGVQGHALRSHQLQEDIKYVFVKDRTFSSLASITTRLVHKVVGFIVWFFGWNFTSVKSSTQLKAPEIILQTARVDKYTDVHRTPDKIIDDGIIPKRASLAQKLLDSGKKFTNKTFIGVVESHNQDLENVPFVAREILNHLGVVTPDTASVAV